MTKVTFAPPVDIQVRGLHVKKWADKPEAWVDANEDDSPHRYVSSGTPLRISSSDDAETMLPSDCVLVRHGDSGPWWDLEDLDPETGAAPGDDGDSAVVGYMLGEERAKDRMAALAAEGKELRAEMAARIKKMQGGGGCPHCGSHEEQLAKVTAERDEALEDARRAYQQCGDIGAAMQDANVIEEERKAAVKRGEELWAERNNAEFAKVEALAELAGAKEALSRAHFELSRAHFERDDARRVAGLLERKLEALGHAEPTLLERMRQDPAFRDAAAMALGIVDRENVATEAGTKIRTDEAGLLDEIVGKSHFHLERMDDDRWWMNLGGVHVNFKASMIHHEDER